MQEKNKIIFIITTPPLENIINNVYEIEELDKDIYERLISHNIPNIHFINNKIHISLTEYVFQEYKIYFLNNLSNTQINFNDKIFYYHFVDFWEKAFKYNNITDILMKEVYIICKYLYIKYLSLQIEIILNYFNNDLLPGNWFVFFTKKYEIIHLYYCIKNNNIQTTLLVACIDDIPFFHNKKQEETNYDTYISPFFTYNSNLFVLKSSTRLSSLSVIFY